MLLLKIFCIIALFVLGYTLVSALFRNMYHISDDHDETIYATTADGWRIALHRIRPDQPDPAKLPVILCHGFGANRFNVHFPGKHSLARYLSRQGYDTFVLELRGTGHSTRSKWPNPGQWDLTFSDFVDFDLPAAIAKVLEVTGSQKLHWVGHSMGGMVAYGYTQKNEAKELASVCAIASPGGFDQLHEMKKILPLATLLKPFSVVRLDMIVGPFIPLIGLWTPKFLEDNYNPKNMSTHVLRGAAANLVTPVATKLLFDFAHFVKTGRFEGSDGTDYIEGLKNIKLPFFFIAGSVDKLAPASVVEPVYQKISSKDKEYRLFGVEQGDQSDYGHGDLLIGESAPSEIFPAVDQWLDKHNGPNK